MFRKFTFGSLTFELPSGFREMSEAEIKKTGSDALACFTSENADVFVDGNYCKETVSEKFGLDTIQDFAQSLFENKVDDPDIYYADDGESEFYCMVCSSNGVGIFYTLFEDDDDYYSVVFCCDDKIFSQSLPQFKAWAKAVTVE